MTALTVGVTTARDPACKRGLATNIAASLARNASISARVCVVDADPHALDVTTRMGLRGPAIEDYARPQTPTIGSLAQLHSPAMAVVPCRGGSEARVHLGAESALPLLRDGFDVVICDLPGGPSGPGSVIGGRLEVLDWLILAVTPEPNAVASAAHFLEHFDTARDRGDVGAVQLAVVCTGDESSAPLSTDEVEAALGRAIVGRVPQLWGRAEPNLGFGPALAIPDLDDAVHDVFMDFVRGRRAQRTSLATL
ncbi:MAG TPA: ParA family protein [Acidimicrobiia bacterium]|nr:ParA family protein [Acidimicrobiia bacterium]